MLTGLLLVASLAVPGAFGDPLVAASDANASDAGAWTLTVTVDALQSDDGMVLAQIFDSSNGFPGEGAKALRQGRATIRGGQARLRWDDLPQGTYAVALMHDENGNGKLDTNLIGMPKEGVGASNNARARFGPFKWKDAKFVHRGATKMTVAVRYY